MKKLLSNKGLHSLVLSLFVLISIVFIANSCTKENIIRASNNIVKQTRSIQNISEVEVSDAIEVYLSMGNEESMYIETSDNLLDYIETIKIGQSLIIQRRYGFHYQGDASVRVYLTLKNVNKIEVSDASYFSVDSLSNLLSISLEVSDASRFKGTVYTDRLIADISDASRLNLSGKVRYYNAEISEASIAGDIGLEVDDLDCEVSDASRFSVKVNKTMRVNITGASEVIYDGDAKIVSQIVTGGSKLVKY